MQQNPQPEAISVRERYDRAYLDYEIENQLAFRDLELLTLSDLRLSEAAAGLFARAASEFRSPRVLDVGCATGALLDALRGRGWEPQGVEICAPMAEYGSRRYGLPIHPGSLESARFPEGSFELVHASHLIEHLNDPGSFLEEVGRVLAPEGLLVLTTPNVSSLQARVFGPAWRSAIYDHLYLFSRRNLVRLLEAHGFYPLRSATWGGWARGQRPAFLKAPLDRLVKPLSIGDVVAVLSLRLARRA